MNTKNHKILAGLIVGVFAIASITAVVTSNKSGENLTGYLQLNPQIKQITPVGSVTNNAANTKNIKIASTVQANLSTKSPASAYLPQKATGVIFTCVDLSADTLNNTLQNLSFNHITADGAKDQEISKMYLYTGNNRLTSAQNINTLTHSVEFSNLNLALPAQTTTTVCLSGDMNANYADKGKHIFEVTNTTSIKMGNSNTTVKGQFPIKGAEMIQGLAVASVSTISNGSLVVNTAKPNQTAARIADFQIMQDSNETASVRRLALTIGGTIQPESLVNLQLYNQDNQLLATVPYVAANKLATFELNKPYKILKGDKQNFYVTANLLGKTGEQIKVYLSEATDLLTLGEKYGMGSAVNYKTGFTPGYDGGTATNGAMGYSLTTLN